MSTQAETVDHLTEVGVKKAEAALQQPSVHDLDATGLTFERNESPKDVPEPNSEAVWKMRTCSDHSMLSQNHSPSHPFHTHFSILVCFPI